MIAARHPRRGAAISVGLAALLLVWSQVVTAQATRVEIFDGETLDGWTQLGGDADYRVEEGVIVGTSKAGTPNSFLRTNETYSDFVLELEFLVDSELNSGVQIRSESRTDYLDGRVHGYQVEIDPSDRAWTGGIYDEARRGWLFPLDPVPAAQEAYRSGEWNHLRIECIETSIRTWLNGVPAAHLVDVLTSDGFIALQVHSVPDELDGREVRWRHLELQTGALDRAPGEFPHVVNLIPNDLAAREKELGWRLLFDGQSSSGWRGAHADSFPTRGWQIADGQLTVLASDGAEAQHGGDIVTVDEFSAFELQLEFKLTEGANSGIKYYVTEGYDAGGGSAIGLEYQLLDDARHPDATQGRDGNRTLASLYDLMTAVKEPRFVHPPNEWNHARLVSRADGHVEHWLNQRKVLEYERGSEAFLALVAISKYRDWEGFGVWDRGHLLLQDHGNLVSFRSIKVRDLPAD